MMNNAVWSYALNSLFCELLHEFSFILTYVICLTIKDLGIPSEHIYFFHKFIDQFLTREC